MYNRIEELCKQKGISGYRLCKDLGYSPSTMTELRKGRVKALSPDKVSAIAKYFDVSTDYILTGEIEKAPTLTSEDLTDEQIELVTACGLLHDIDFEMLTGVKILDIGKDPQKELDNLIDKRTRLVTVAHVSNVLGLVNPISEMAERCHSRGVPLLVDGAQGIVHEKVDVGALGCDFYVFSGHKIYAAPGTGVLYARKGLMEDLPPYMGGGEMIASVGWEKTEYESAPRRFEAGTQNFTSVPTLSPALDLAVRMGRGNLDRITGYMLEALGRREKIRLYGKPSPAARKVPLFSITVDGVHHEDIALILDKMGIAVRSGQMCAEPLMHRFGVEGMLRASFAPYNTLEEAQYFIESLDRAVEMLSR